LNLENSVGKEKKKKKKKPQKHTKKKKPKGSKEEAHSWSGTLRGRSPFVCQPAGTERWRKEKRIREGDAHCNRKERTSSDRRRIDFWSG